MAVQVVRKPPAVTTIVIGFIILISIQIAELRVVSRDIRPTDSIYRPSDSLHNLPDHLSVSIADRDAFSYFKDKTLIRTGDLNVEMHLNRMSGEEFTRIQRSIVDDIGNFKELFGFGDFERKKTLEVYLFNDDNDYIRNGTSSDFADSFGFRLPPSSLGAASQNPYMIFATKENIDVLRHEMAHALTFHAAGFKAQCLPAAIIEGVAEYFEILYGLESRKKSTFHVQRAYDFVVNAETSKDSLDGRVLISSSRSFRNRGIDVYSLGYSLVSYLQETSATLIRELLQEVSTSDCTEEVRDYRNNYGRKLLEDHGKAFQEWLRNAYNKLTSKMSLDSDLREAAANGNLDRVEELIDEGADVNGVDDDNGWTALHHAASKDRLLVAVLLLQKGADTDVKSREGQTPLGVAFRHKSFRTFRLLKLFVNGNNDPDEKEFEKSTQNPSQEEQISQELINAIREGDIDQVRDAVRLDNAIVYATTRSGWTILHFAAVHGKTEIIEFLVNAGANIEAKIDSCSYTPLHLAVKANELDTVKLLVKNNANVNAMTGGELCLGTPLHIAAATGYVEIAKYLLSMGADISAFDSSDDGRSPIHLAAATGNKNIVELFLNEGVSVNALTSKYNVTPLHCASLKGQLDVVEFLVDLGADVNATDTTPYGRQPIHAAAEGGHKIIIEYFFGIGASDVATKFGWTLLHFAALSGQAEVVEYLIHRGSDINAQDHSLMSLKPFHVAIFKGHKTIVELFFSNGISIEDVGFITGWRPLHFAALSGQSEIAKLLVDRGADVKAEDDFLHNEMAIHLAAGRGHKNVIDYFLDEVGNVNEFTSKNGWTTLHAAEARGQLHIVMYLVERGADIGAKDEDGKTALDVALENDHNDIVKYFQDREQGK